MPTPSFELWQGDCLVEMSRIPDGSVDAVICDLPYGTTACSWDSVIPFAPLWEAYRRVLKPNGAVILTASQPFTSALVMSNPKWFRFSLVWDKVNRYTGSLNAKRMPMRRHEDIIVFAPKTTVYNPQMIIKPRVKFGNKYGHGAHTQFGKNVRKQIFTKEDRENPEHYPCSILEIPSCTAEIDGTHPTQKPVALMAYLIRTYTNPGDLVLDNTCGSGTTGVAALQEGRRFIGIEKDPHYFAVASERLRQAAAAPPLFNLAELEAV